MALLELATVDDVSVYPGMDKVGIDDRLWLEKLIRAFSKRAENYCNREFYLEARTQTFSPEGWMEFIQLPAFGASGNSVTTVHEDSERGFGATYLLVATDYYFDWRTGLLSRDVGRWLVGQGVVQVVWTGGFGTSVEDVPDDLRVAAVMQVVFWWQRRNELGLQSKNLQGGSVSISAPSKLLPEVQDILDQYKVHTV